jgi:putative ABC transport system substrate-binding protein
MKRREFITILGGAAVAWPLAARGQTAVKRPLIGFLQSGSKEATAFWTSAFSKGMRDHGYVEGQSYEIAYRFADDDVARLPALARELVQLKPNVIVASNTTAALAAKKATQSIPIVSPIFSGAVKLGLVKSRARPGGNVTGILTLVEGLSGKQVEIALQLIPAATKLGVLFNPTNPADMAQRQEIEAAATAKGIKVVAAEVRIKSDLDPAFTSLTAAGVQVVIVVRDSLLLAERVPIAELAAAAHLPTVAGAAEMAEAGELIAYGTRITANVRRAAYFVERILKGAKASDLPVEFPTKVELVINLKTAKALGITVPPSLLTRADEVIE